jgi:hypothetical protein
MQPDIKTEVSPFAVGDCVRPVEAADDWLALTGQRSVPGWIHDIAGEAHLVRQPDGLILPFRAADLERVP